MYLHGNFWVPDIVLHNESHRITLRILRMSFKGGVQFRAPFRWVHKMRWPYISAHVISITTVDGGPLRIRKKDYAPQVLQGMLWDSSGRIASEKSLSSWVGEVVNIVPRPDYAWDNPGHGRYSYTQNMQIFSSDWVHEVKSLARGDSTLYKSNLPWNVLWDMAEKQELLQSIPLTRHPRTELSLKDRAKARKISNTLW